MKIMENTLPCVPGDGYITDPTSMVDVERNLPDFYNTQIMIDKVVVRPVHNIDARIQINVSYGYLDVNRR